MNSYQNLCFKDSLKLASINGVIVRLPWSLFKKSDVIRYYIKIEKKTECSYCATLYQPEDKYFNENHINLLFWDIQFPLVLVTLVLVAGDK